MIVVLRMHFHQLLAAAAAVLLLVSPLGAAEPQMEVTVGFDNVCKVGHWAPVQIRVTAADAPLSGQLALTAIDGDGVDCLYVAEPRQTIEVPAGEARLFTRYVRVGRARGRLLVQLRGDDAEIASQQITLGSDTSSLYSTQRWLLVVGGRLNLNSLIYRYRAQTLHALAVTSVADGQQLPEQWFGYEGVDTIILTTARRELIEQLTPAQLHALEQWTRMGGTLLISVGANAAELAGEGGLLRRFVPSAIAGSEEVLEAPGIESFARAESPLPAFTMAKLQPTDAQVVTYVEGRAQGERPAILRAPYSFGKTIVLGFDIESAPWSDWQHTSSMLETVLFGAAERRSEDSENQEVRRIGYDEMSGQLRGALDHFGGGKDRPAVTVITFWTVFPLLLVYIALIGPGDFFLLKRFFRRMECTWITFPLLIVATSITIYVVGKYWRGGNILRLNQVDVVDVDVASGFLRGTTWAQLYNPSSAAYQLQLQPQPALASESPRSAGSLLSWQGLPGIGLGGFDSLAVDLMSTTPYRIAANSTSDASSLNVQIENLLLPTATTKGFLGRWWREQAAPELPILRVDHNGVLHGLVQNPLSLPLTDAIIAHDQWVYRLEQSLDPGQLMSVDGLVRRDLEWRLTRRRVLQSTTDYSSTPWNSQDRAIQRIMEVMMFYDAAGGQNYTGLAQQYQGFVDLTEQLKLGRAILVGRSARPAADLQRDSESLTGLAEQQWTWYRLILPVERSRVAPAIEDESFEGILH